MAKKKFDLKFRKLIQLLNIIFESDDDTGTAYREGLNEVSKLRLELLNKYRKHLEKEEADLRNEAEQMVFQTEKALEDLKDKVSDGDKEKAENLVKELKSALEGTDIELIKNKTEELSKVAMDLAAKVYESVKPEGNSEENTNGSEEKENKKDDVEEATFEEK